MRSSLRLALVASGLAAIGLAGCGGDGLVAPETFPVSGTVTIKGKPAIGVRVQLHPQFDIGDIKFVPSGETGPEGTFTISTAAPGDGAPPGEYAITLEKPRIISDRSQSGIETEIDDFKGKYSDPQQSPWKVTIVEGDNPLKPFELDE